MSNKFVFFIFIYTIGAKTIISAKKYLIQFMTKLTLIMKRFNHIIWLFEAYIYYVYTLTDQKEYICVLYVEKWNMWTKLEPCWQFPLFSQNQPSHPWPSWNRLCFSILPRENLCSNLVIYRNNNQICSNLVIYRNNIQTISINNNLNHTINHLLLLSNYDQNLVEVGLVSWKIVQSVTHSNYSLYGQHKGKFNK